MQPLVLDIRGNPIEDSYFSLIDKMLSKTVILCWDVKDLQRKADQIDFTSCIDSYEKGNKRLQKYYMNAHNPLKVVQPTEDMHLLVNNI